MSCFHEESGCNKSVKYVCLNAVLVEFSLIRRICGRGLIRIRLNYHEESGFSISRDTISALLDREYLDVFAMFRSTFPIIFNGKTK